MALAAPAAAATRWSPPLDIARGAAAPELASLRDGTTIAALGYHVPRMDADRMAYDDGHVEAAVRPPGGVFGFPVGLTRRGELLGGLVTNFGDDSVLHIMYSWGHADPSAHKLIPRLGASGFGPQEPVPDGATYGGYLDERGGFTLTGRGEGGPPWVRTRAADGTWGPKRLIESAPSWGYGGSVIVDPDGTITVLHTTAGEIQTVSAPPGGEFGAPKTVAKLDGPPTGASVLVHDAHGGALFAWVTDEQFASGRLHTISRGPGGGFGPVRSIPGDPIRYASSVGVAMNAAGDAAIVWSSLFGQTAASYRSRGGGWQRAVALPDNMSDSTGPPAVGIGAGGDAVTVYQSPDLELVSVDHPAGHGWQRAEVVGPARGGDSSVAVDADGEATAAWRWWDDDGRGGVRIASHRIAPLPPEHDPAPSVDDFRLRSSKAFTYRVSEKGRVEITVRRARARLRRAVAAVRVKAGRGENRTKLPKRVRRLLSGSARYRARIVAIDRHGQYSKPRAIALP